MTWKRTPHWQADPRAWSEIVALFPAGVEWPRAVVVEDLYWYADQIRMGRETLPGRRLLAKRWGWTERRARTILREIDPLELGRPTDVPPASQERPTDVPQASRSSRKKRGSPGPLVPPASQERPTDVPPASQERPHARTTEHRAQNTEQQISPIPPQGALSLTAPAADAPDLAPALPLPCGVLQSAGAREGASPEGKIPDWARKAATKEAPAAKWVEVVTEVLTEIRGKPGAPATDARHIVTLWKALERPPLDELGADLKLVAKAARESPDKLFARGIRAEGWDEGTDRSRHVSTICVQKHWGDRLEAARAWEGQPTTANRSGQRDLTHWDWRDEL